MIDSPVILACPESFLFFEPACSELACGEFIEPVEPVECVKKESSSFWDHELIG